MLGGLRGVQHCWPLRWAIWRQHSQCILTFCVEHGAGAGGPVLVGPWDLGESTHVTEARGGAAGTCCRCRGHLEGAGGSPLHPSHHLRGQANS